MVKTRKNKISVEETDIDINEQDFFHIEQNTNTENIEDTTTQDENYFALIKDKIDKLNKNLDMVEFELIINGKKYLTYEELINDKENITMIDLSNKNLIKIQERFFDALTKLHKLAEFKISNNYLNTLSPKLFDCVSIKKLDLSKNILCLDATKYIYKLTNLEELNLSNCGDFSENICYLPKLKILDLSKNYKCSYIERIEKCLNQQKQIWNTTKICKEMSDKFLNLDSEKDFVVPSEIYVLQNLEKLNLSFCQLKTFPENIFRLKKLVNLNLSNNKLKTIPNKINKLINLDILDIENNNIQILPEDEICQLKKLNTIKFSSGCLTKVTSKIWEMPGIFSLDLRDVKVIPKKNNDQDIELTLIIGAHIPNKIKRLILVYNWKKDRNLDNVPFDVEYLTIVINSAIKVDNLPINLKKITIKAVDSYDKKNDSLIKEYINNRYIKVPFGCELIYQ